GGEGLVGVGGADDEVDLLEEVGRGVVDVDAESLEAGGVLGPVHVGEAHPHAQVVGELVGAVRQELVQQLHGAGQAGHRPYRARLGELDLHVDLPQTGRLDQRVGQVAHDGLDLRVHDGAAHCWVDGDAQTGQVVGPEPRFPPLHARKAVGVAGVVAVDTVDPAGRVAH